MSTNYISIAGYFCISKEYPESLDRVLLDRDIFKQGIKRINPENLEIPEGFERLYGNFVNAIEVVAVFDTAEGSLIPFFIDKKKLKKLQDIVAKAKPAAIMNL